jgi:tellurite resistance protein TerC
MMHGHGSGGAHAAHTAHHAAHHAAHAAHPPHSAVHHAPLPSQRLDQIRFAPEAAAGVAADMAGGEVASVAAQAVAPASTAKPQARASKDAVGEGNGGDDFTFSFPRHSEDLYRVYAFGFEVLDDTNTENETLSIYDTSSKLIGVLELNGADGGGASDPASSFYGFVSTLPIGYASFDENAAADTIGLAGFVFGYKEHEKTIYPSSAWLLFGGMGLVVLLIERAPLRRHAQMSLPAAAAWLLWCSMLVTLAGVTLWAARGWRQATLYSACFLLNSMLSGDNLVVFMLLLQQAGLDRRHHVAAISHGMLLALGVRILLSLAGAVLLQRFSWLLLVFATFLLFAGCRMLWYPEEIAVAGGAKDSRVAAPGADGESAADVEGGGASSASCAVRCIGACVPLYWSDATGGRYFARNEAGRWSATRMAVCVVGISLSDVVFAMDSVPVILSLTTSPFVLVASQTLSLLWLRPVYFLLAALASYLDSMQQMLAVVLVLISLKIFLESAGVEVPVAAFLSLLAGWRVLALLYVVCARRADRDARGGREGMRCAAEGGAAELDEAEDGAIGALLGAGKDGAPC